MRHCGGYAGLLLTTVSGSDSCIGRLGGDEFLVFAPSSQLSQLQPAGLTRLLNRLQSGGTLSLSGSVGSTTIDSPENFSYNLALRQADAALYQSKKNGKNQFSFYQDPDVAALTIFSLCRIPTVQAVFSAG